MQVDYLIKAFKGSGESVLGSFKLLKVNEELRELYYGKLQRYISEKERLIMQVNRKKSKNRVKEVVPSLSSRAEIEEVYEFINKVKTVPKNYEQVYVEEIVPQLTSGLKKVDRTVGSETAKMRENVQMLEKIQNKVKSKKNELKKIQ